MKYLIPLAAIILPSMCTAELVKLESFEAGSKGTEIIKLQDTSNGVYCYVLKPTSLHYNLVQDYGGSSRQFDANNVGSISCVSTSQQRQPQNK